MTRLLVDSSVHIDWLRRRIHPGDLLGPWLRAGQLVSCGIVRVEVLRGILRTDQKDRVQAFLDLIPEAPLDQDLCRAAADLAWQLDRQGTVLPATDVLIAACTIRTNSTLITTDPHFSRIPGLPSRTTLPTSFDSNPH